MEILLLAVIFVCASVAVGCVALLIKRIIEDHRD